LSSTLIEPTALAENQLTTDTQVGVARRRGLITPGATAATPGRLPPMVRGEQSKESLESVKERVRVASNETVKQTAGSTAPKATLSPSAQDVEIARQRALLKMQAAITAQTSFESATLVFCNELARALKAHRVSMGVYAKGHSTVLVTNNGDAKKLDRSAAKSLALAMDEAIDQANVVTAPELEETLLINQAVMSVRKLHGGPVIAIPSIVQDRPEGAFLIELAKDSQLNALVIAFARDAVSLYAPILSLMQRDELGTLKRLKLSFRRKSKNVMKDESRWVRWSFIFVLASLLILSFVPVSHTVSSQARIEGALVRTISAPTQGFIKKVFVRPGDTVQLDQPLAELADRELQLERNKLLSEVATHDAGYMTAMARNDRAAMMQSQSKQSESKVQLELIDQQLSRGVLLAPIEGVVIEGDLTQQVGSPVERGQNLMTVSPKNRFRTIVELDERDIRFVKPGMTASLSLSALPWNDIEIKIDRINPMAVVRDGRNVFEIEARVEKADQPEVLSQLRPGLRGVAKVNVGSESIMNTYARRASEALQRAWWRWAP
jgi:multidrug resistance efflux pump